jgi:CRP/FNR family transcriptional regulator
MVAATPRLRGEDIDFLALLTETRRRQFLVDSRRVEFPAGTVAFRPHERPISFVVIRGFVRVYRALPDGRQATVAFIHANELVGATSIVAEPASVFVQVVVDSTVTMLELDTVRNLSAAHIDVLDVVARHLAVQLDHSFRLTSIRSLGDVREQLAYDLLERACKCQLMNGRLEVRATHAELADSIGSSREVVSRALKALRAAGMVTTAPGVVRIVEPVRLAGIVRAFAV